MSLTVAKIRMDIDVAGGDKAKRELSGIIESASEFAETAEGLEGRLSRFSDPIKEFGKGSLEAASDLNESMSAVQTAFGDASSSVFGFSGSTAQSLGLAQGDALGAATAFGVLGKAAGLSGNDLANMSNDMVQASVDLASFNNMSVDDVLVKMRGGLTGEMEGLKSLGITMTQTEVDAKGLAMGFSKVNGEFSQGDMLLIRKTLLMEKLGDAQGDNARTNAGYAGQVKIANAMVKEFQASIGQLLIPVMTKLLGVGIQVLGFLTEMPTPFKVVGVVIGATVVGLTALVGAIALAAYGVAVAGPMMSLFAGEVAATGEAAAVAAGPLNGMFGPIMLIVGALVLIGVAYKKNWLGFGDAVRSVAGVIGQHLDRVTQRIRDFLNLFKMFTAMKINPISAGFKALGLVLNGIGLEKIGMFLYNFGDQLRVVGAAINGFRKTGLASTKMLDGLPGPLKLAARFLLNFANLFQNLIQSFKRGTFLKDLPKTFRLLGRELGKIAEHITGIKGLGDAFANVFDKIGTGIVMAVKWFQELMRVFQIFRRSGLDPIQAAMAALGHMIPGMAGIFKAFGGVVESNIAVFKALFNVIALVVKGFQSGGLKGALAGLGKGLKGVGTAVLDMIKSLAGLYAEVGKALYSLFDKVPWGDVGSYLWGLFTGMIAAIPWSTLGDWIVDAGTWLLTKGAEIIGGLMQGALNFWEDPLKPWLLKIGGMIVEHIPAMIGLLKSLGSDLLEGLKNGAVWGWDNVVKPELLALPGQILTAFKAGVVVGEILLPIGKDVLQGLWTGAQWTWDNVLLPGIKAIPGLLLDGVKLYGDYLKLLYTIGTYIIQGLYTGITFVWDNFVKPWIGSIGTKLTELLPDDVSNALKKVSDAITPIKDAAQTVKDMIGGAATTIAGALSGIIGVVKQPLEDVISLIDRIADAAQTAIDLLNKIPGVNMGSGGRGKDSSGVPIGSQGPGNGSGGIQTGFPPGRDGDTSNPGTETGGAVPLPFFSQPIPVPDHTDFDGAMKTLGQNVKTAFNTTKTDVGAALDAMGTLFVSWGTRSVNTGTQTGSNFQRVVSTAFDRTRSAVANTLSMTEQRLGTFSQQAGTLGGRAGSAFSNSLSNALARVSAICGQAINTAQNILGNSGWAGNSGFRVGDAWGNGLYNGIGSWINRIASKAADAINAAEDAARRAQDMRSPSRKAYRLGRYWTRGLANGIGEGAGEVAAASRGLEYPLSTPGFSGGRSRITGGASEGPVQNFLVISADLLDDVLDAVDGFKVLTSRQEVARIFGASS